MVTDIKTLFYHKVKSYILIALFGLAAGFLVAFFSRFSYDDLWSFSSFSSATFGFWIFTTSVIVLLSEKRLTAGINAFLYVYMMFFITGIHKIIRNICLVYQPDNTVISSLAGNLLYGLLPAVICGILGIILWNGRKNNLAGKLLVLLPLIFLIGEAVVMFHNVLTQHRLLFQSIIDIACVVAYIIIFHKYILPQKHRE